MKDKKKLAYWGAGDYGKLCVEQHPEIKPDFFIDSNWGKNNYCGIPVIRPAEVTDWKQLYIVITTSAIVEIEKILNAKNLIRNEDYVRYKDFFSVLEESLEEKVLKTGRFISENTEYINATLIVAPVFISRVSEDMINFFRQYGIKRAPKKCVMLTDLQVIKSEEAEKIMGYPVFDFSEICYWNGVSRPGIDIDIERLTHGKLLSKKEKEWIFELEEKKTCENKKLSYKVTAEIYWYLKNIFLLINPSRVIIWGAAERQSCILAKLAQEMQIPFGYMEHGWIPGTFQFDKYWVEDYQKYDTEPKLDLAVENRKIKIKEIKDYIINNKIDTGKYREIEEDEKELRRINRKRKTIFLIGTDDCGIGINPQSDYWKSYILPSFSSTSEAALFIAGICKKNDWNFVFKPHPNFMNGDEVDKIDNTIIRVKYTEIDRLICLADVIVSIGSKADYKVLMYGKPLIKLGRMTLYKKGCSYKCDDKYQIEQEIKNALDMGMTKEQTENFELHMAQLLEYHLWDDMTNRELRFGLSLDTDFFDIQNMNGNDR